MQVSPLGDSFSVAALLQVHFPTGRAPQEQVGPAMVFSAGAAEQVQWRADCFPQEQVACWAGGALAGPLTGCSDVLREMASKRSRGVGCWE